MKGRYLSNWLAFMTCAQLAAGAVTNAHAGAKETIAFGGTVNQLLGTGNGVANGSTVSGDIIINLSTLLLIAGNGSSSYASIYSSDTAIVNETINGDTTTTEGANFFITFNGLDSHGNNVDALTIAWGSDSLFVDYPSSLFSDSSPNSIQTAFNAGLSGSVPYSGDAEFNVGMDPSGFNGAQGNLSYFHIVTPSPLLSISLLTNNQVRVSWPTNNADGFQLYSSPSLGTNASWTAITNLPTSAGTKYNVILPAANGTKFFQLQSTN